MIEKCLDTDARCAPKKDWVIGHFDLLTSPYTPVAYLDEKWFIVLVKEDLLR